MFVFVLVCWSVIICFGVLNAYLWHQHKKDRDLMASAVQEVELSQKTMDIFESVGSAKTYMLACYEARVRWDHVEMCRLAAYVVKLAHDSYAEKSRGLPWWATDDGFLKWKANTEAWRNFDREEAQRDSVYAEKVAR